MGMIRSEGLKEGDLLYKFHQARFNANRNVLGVILGPTGSGKSYTALRICEIEYERRFKKPFPPENITFSIGQTMKRIQAIKETGRKGEIIMPDDIGASGFGAMEFQSKSSRMFSYILQAFRSLNIGLLMTLPVLTMLNKTGRQLVHYQLITQGIDYANKSAKVKPLFHQLNQSSGKSYWKYPNYLVNNRVLTFKRLNYSMPSKELCEKYEEKKLNFLTKLTGDFVDELDAIEVKKHKGKIKYPRDIEFECYHLNRKAGIKQREIAERIGKTERTVRLYIEKVENFLKEQKIVDFSKQNAIIEGKNTQKRAYNLTS